MKLMTLTQPTTPRLAEHGPYMPWTAPTLDTPLLAAEDLAAQLPALGGLQDFQP